MQVRTGQLWHAAVDYYRITARGGEDEGNEDTVIPEYERIASSATLGLVKWEPWKWLGFKGKRLGSLAYGHNGADRWIYQGSGLSAQPLYDLRLPHDNCSRLDIQVTIWYGEQRPALVKAVAAAANTARVGKRGRAFKVRYIDGMGDGDTAYIGTRGKKSKFLRCYDKGAETKGAIGYENAYRFEAELTDIHAREAEGTLHDTGSSPEVVYGLVAAYFAERGVILPSQDGCEFYQASKLPKDEGSTARRLRWLEEQVSPAIDKLYSDGVPLSLISKALGFTEFQQWERRQWL